MVKSRSYQALKSAKVVCDFCETQRNGIVVSFDPTLAFKRAGNPTCFSGGMIASFDILTSYCRKAYKCILPII
jgi:hypothetical protein